MAATGTVGDRVALARHELALRDVLLGVALAGALGLALLALQEPMVHDALHNFRHSAGVTCH